MNSILEILDLFQGILILVSAYPELAFLGLSSISSVAAGVAVCRLSQENALHSLEILTSSLEGVLVGGGATSLPKRLLTRRGRIGRLARRLEPAALQFAAQRNNDREILEAILRHIPQGLCMFGEKQELIVCNSRFHEIYGLAETAVRTGMHISDLLDACRDAGNYSQARRTEIEASLARQLRSQSRLEYNDSIRDGRVVSVVRTPFPSGGWVTTFEDVTERKRTEAKIGYLAHHDPLTGLSNRTAFHERLDESMSSLRGREQLALLYMDLDQFKSVNDNLGHPVGDELLQHVAARLRQCLRNASVVARLGGDEFAIIEPNFTWADEVGALASRIVEVVSAPYQIAGQQIVIGASIGVALAPKDAIDSAGLIKAADSALYLAKSRGKNTYCYATKGGSGNADA